MVNKKSTKKNRKEMNRKSVLFTLISLLLAVFFVTTFSIDFDSTSSQRTPAINTRISILNVYVKNFQTYSEDSLQVASYRTLDSMYTQSLDRHRFFNDFNEFNNTFSNCLICGTLNCTNVAASKCAGSVNGNDMTTLLNNITSLAYKNLNIQTNYSINSISFYQDSPFDIHVVMNLSYNVSDNIQSEYASWSTNFVTDQQISIIGLYDPLSGVNTNDVYKKRIKSTSICGLDLSCWNLANTQAFYNNKEFRYYPNGTGYLERFWNGTGKFCTGCGIESFVNVTYANGNFSYVDTMYWNNPPICSINNRLYFISAINESNKPLVLDSSAVTRYGLGFNWSSCPH